jgi:flavin reductase (DIM6/NTAB) family NADH-FMN oxidoreductase RutF
MDDLTAAMGRIPSGLFVLTVVHQRRKLAMVASWIMQADFSPPLVTVALHRDRPLGKALEAGTECVVNILPTGAKKLLIQFGNLNDDEPSDPFDGIALLDEPGPPILAEAHAYLRGRQVRSMESGDHRIHLLGIESGKVLNPGEVMVHVRRTGMIY